MAFKKKPVSKTMKTFYGVGDLGFNWMTSIETYYFNYFLTNIANLGLGITAAITTITGTIDALLSWIYGAIINSSKPMKWGRYRSWLAVVPWLVPIFYYFQFARIGAGWLAAIVIIVGDVVSHILWNIPFVANMSMVAIAANSPEDRVALSTSRGMWSMIGRLAYSFVGPYTVALFARWLGDKYSYAATAFLFGVVMAVLYFAHFVMFKGSEPDGEALRAMQEAAKANKKKAEDKTSAGDLAKALFKNAPLLVFLVAELARMTWSFVVAGTIAYYFKYVSPDHGSLPTFLLITSLMGIISTYISKPVAKKIGARKTYIFCMVLCCVGSFAAYFCAGTYALLLVMMCVAYFGLNATNGLSPAIYSDIIIYSEWKTGKNATGWIMGLSNVPIKVGVVLRGVVINAVLAAGGFATGMTAADAPASLSHSISIGFTLIPAAIAAFSLILVTCFFRITPDKVKKYEGEIKERTAGAVQA